MDKTFVLEIGAMLEMHGATGKAMLQEEVIKLLPSGGRRKSLAAACQALEELNSSSLFTFGCTDNKAVVEAVYELFSGMRAGQPAQIKNIQGSDFMTKVIKLHAISTSTPSHPHATHAQPPSTSTSTPSHPSLTLKVMSCMPRCFQYEDTWKGKPRFTIGAPGLDLYAKFVEALHKEEKCTFEHLSSLQVFSAWCSEQANAITEKITKDLVGALTVPSKRKSTKSASTAGAASSSVKKAATKELDERAEREMLLGGMLG